MATLKTKIGPRNDKQTLESGSLAEVTALVATYKTPASVCDESGRTIKDFLLRRYNFNAVPLLLKIGVTFTQDDVYARCSLSGAMSDSQAQMLVERYQAFKDVGLSLTGCDKRGNTLFHNAARTFNAQLFEFLLDASVEPAVLNDKNESALHLLVERSDDNTLDFFTHHKHAIMADGDSGLMRALGDPIDGLEAMRTAQQNLTRWAARLIDAGCDPWTRTKEGRSVFDGVRPSQMRWTQAFCNAQAGSDGVDAFMAVFEGQTKNRPESYSPGMIALIEMMEQKSGKTYLNRTPFSPSMPTTTITVDMG
jgi:hypothetical protein